ncbi:hypothetical protein F5141DRAFT_1210192 [Pisolithus sp. B1]|nr:hypothetical protein F5141DRAFT_1210192 [Pisolithus sp. B1]
MSRDSRAQSSSSIRFTSAVPSIVLKVEPSTSALVNFPMSLLSALRSPSLPTTSPLPMASDIKLELERPALWFFATYTFIFMSAKNAVYAVVGVAKDGRAMNICPEDDLPALLDAKGQLDTGIKSTSGTDDVRNVELQEQILRLYIQ